MLKKIAIVLVLLLPNVSFAWLFQPQTNDNISEDTVLQFSSASEITMSAFSIVFSTFSQAEGGEISISDVGSFSDVVGSLETARELYTSLPQEELESVLIDQGLIAQNTLRMIQRQGVEITTVKDLADYAASSCNQIAQLMIQLEAQKFGPNDAANEESRRLVNQLTWKIAEFTVVLNSISGALAVQ